MTLLGAALAACTPEGSGGADGDLVCTLIGCSSTVSVTAKWSTAVPVPLNGSVCIEEADCFSLTVDAAAKCTLDAVESWQGGCRVEGTTLFLDLPISGLGSNDPSPPAEDLDPIDRQVSVTLTTPDGATILHDVKTITLHAHQPNGPECAPICYSGSNELTVP